MKRRTITLAATAAILVAGTGAAVVGTAMADQDQPKIIGGGPATEDYPAVASLQYAKDGDPNHHGCGVALIDPEYVLTAAHCVSEVDGTPKNPDDYHISIGSTDRTAGEKIQIADIAVHPYYASDAPQDGDIAVLKLAEEASQKPIAIGDATEVGTEVRMVGWGRTVADDPASLPKVLQELDSTILEDKKCIFGDEWDITEGDLCVDTPGDVSGPCYGDSGSPLLTKNDAGEWVTLGTVSRAGGDSCLDTDEVYASAVYYEDWIDEAVHA